MSNNKKNPKQPKIQTDHFSQEIREFPEVYLIQQFWSSIPGYTSGGYVCTQVHSSDLFLTLVMPGLIQVCPFLARRGFKLMLWLQEFPLRTLSSRKQHTAKQSTSTFCSAFVTLSCDTLVPGMSQALIMDVIDSAVYSDGHVLAFVTVICRFTTADP